MRAFFISWSVLRGVTFLSRLHLTDRGGPQHEKAGKASKLNPAKDISPKVKEQLEANLMLMGDMDASAPLRFIAWTGKGVCNSSKAPLVPMY